MIRPLVRWVPLALASVAVGSAALRADDRAAPLVIGETFVVESKALGEARRVNMYAPPGHGGPAAPPLPALYMPDGGVAEDFLHVAGLVQVLVGNGTMRPFRLVGIENTQRRRDLTGPTDNSDDKKIAPKVGGSAAFRKFIRDELMPEVKRRYRAMDEAAVIGESLAGLFVVETFLLEPDLFDTYIAVDPSLWWNDQKLVGAAGGHLKGRPGLKNTLYLASSGEERMPELAGRLVAALEKDAPKGVRWQYTKLAEERHATVFHPATMKAFREVLKPAKR
jgi:predicted alpha/beta superfamily hydrolase